MTKTAPPTLPIQAVRTALAADGTGELSAKPPEGVELKALDSAIRSRPSLPPEDSARSLLRCLRAPLDEEEVALLSGMIQALPPVAAQFLGHLASALDPRDPWTALLEAPLTERQQALTEALGCESSAAAVVASCVFPAARRLALIHDWQESLGEQLPSGPLPKGDTHIVRMLITDIGCACAIKGKRQSAKINLRLLKKDDYLARMAQERLDAAEKAVRKTLPKVPTS